MADEQYERNFYRDNSGRLMCSGCKTEVFGGVCKCRALNSQQAPRLTVMSQPAYDLLSQEESSGRRMYGADGRLSK